MVPIVAAGRCLILDIKLVPIAALGLRSPKTGARWLKVSRRLLRKDLMLIQPLMLLPTLRRKETRVGKGNHPTLELLLLILCPGSSHANYEILEGFYHSLNLLVMGNLLSRPKALAVILIPGGAWRRLYSLESTS